jgi:hypothetical protein
MNQNVTTPEMSLQRKVEPFADVFGRAMACWLQIGPSERPMICAPRLPWHRCRGFWEMWCGWHLVFRISRRPRSESRALELGQHFDSDGGNIVVGAGLERRADQGGGLRCSGSEELGNFIFLQGL